MNLRFSAHAVTRMQERNISVSEVESIVAMPDGKIQQSRDKWVLVSPLPRSEGYRLATALDESKGPRVRVELSA